jgi:hypothetical protein
MADLRSPAELARLHAVTIAEHDQFNVVKVICAVEELLAAAGSSTGSSRRWRTGSGTLNPSSGS